MEQTIQNPDPVSEPVQKKAFLPIFISILLAATIVGGGIYFLQNKQISKLTNEKRALQDQISSLQNQPKATPTTVSKSENPETSDWQTYTNPQYGYSIKYPDGWRKVDFEGGAGFGPKEIGEDVFWGVRAYDSMITSDSEIIDEIGKQFDDRNVKTDEFTTGGKKATKVTVTTPSVPAWYSETILFANPNAGFTISVGNGAVQRPDFELFYESFSF